MSGMEGTIGNEATSWATKADLDVSLSDINLNLFEI